MTTPDTSYDDFHGLIDMGFDDDHVESMLGRFHKLRERKQRQKRAAIAVATVLIATLGAFLFQDRIVPEAQQPTVQQLALGATLQGSQVASLQDGSTVTATEATLQLAQATDERMQLELRKGKATFEVSKNPQRKFVVRADDTSVTVLGTVFTVERKGKTSVQVSVTEGRVQVDGADGRQHILTAGDTITVPAHGPGVQADPNNTLALGDMVDVEPETSEPPRTEEDTKPRRKKARRKKTRRNKTDWRALAKKGDYAAARQEIEREDDVRDNLSDLMLAADAMRLGGKPAKAVDYLDRAIQNYPSDKRAPLALFTRGRILLKKKPARAARDFAKLRKLQPKSSLAEDALAREVEAHHRAKNKDAARKLAQDYLDRYPEGRRTRAVKRYGDLD